jgi:hypothetical protein
MRENSTTILSIFHPPPLFSLNSLNLSPTTPLGLFSLNSLNLSPTNFFNYFS